MNQGVVIDFADIFFTDFAQLGFGFLDRNRTAWHKVKTYPEQRRALEVEATFGGGRGGRVRRRRRRRRSAADGRS